MKTPISLIIEFLIEAIKLIPKAVKRRKVKKEPKKIPFDEYLETARDRAKNREKLKPRKVELDPNPYE